MINLLPENYKLDIRAARTNVVLLRYIVMTVIAILLLGGLIFGSYVVLKGAQENAEAKVRENEQRVAAYQDVKTRADSFRSDLATAKSILDNDVIFTKLIYRIADTVPPNIVLDGLTLEPNNFGNNMTLNASAKTIRDASSLKDSFTKSGGLFSSVQIQTIRSGANTDTYPVKVVLNVVLNKGALE